MSETEKSEWSVKDAIRTRSQEAGSDPAGDFKRCFDRHSEGTFGTKDTGKSQLIKSWRDADLVVATNHGRPKTYRFTPKAIIVAKRIDRTERAARKLNTLIEAYAEEDL